MNKVEFNFPDIKPVDQVCLITMVKDEDFFLSIWIEHYTKEFEKPNFIIFDHNSTYPVKKWVCEKYPNVNISVVDVPAIPFDDMFKSNILSMMASTMTSCYKSVIASDVDEIVFGVNESLSCVLDSLPDYTAPIGMEFVQRAGFESEYNKDECLLKQRNSVQLLSGYTKPIIWKKPAKYSAGLHGIDKEYKISYKLVLAHLRFIDEKYARNRQDVRNSIKFSIEQTNKNMGSHWKSKDSEWIGSWIFNKANNISSNVSNEVSEFILNIEPAREASGFYKHAINKSSPFLDFNKVREALILKME